MIQKKRWGEGTNFFRADVSKRWGDRNTECEGSFVVVSSSEDNYQQEMLHWLLAVWTDFFSFSLPSGCLTGSYQSFSRKLDLMVPKIAKTRMFVMLYIPWGYTITLLTEKACGFSSVWFHSYKFSLLKDWNSHVYKEMTPN